MAVLGILAVSTTLGATGCSTFYDDCKNGLCSTFKDGGGGGAAATGSGMISASSGGMGGSMPATSSGGTGGGASSTSSGDCSQAPSDTICGPDGDDARCDGVVGDCGTKTIFVGLKIDNETCGAQASDVYMTDSTTDLIPGGFTLVTQYKAFKAQLSNTVPLVYCKAAGKNRGTVGAVAPCTPTDTAFRILGYVSTKPAAGYEQLQELFIPGGASGIVAQNDTYANVCCHASCSLVTAYVPP